MEDFLYIIGIIAWVAYSFYKNSQKVKKNRPVSRKPIEESPEQTRDVRSFLEELLGEAEPHPEVAVPREDLITTTYSPAPVPEYVSAYQERELMNESKKHFSYDEEYEEKGFMPWQYQQMKDKLQGPERILAVASLDERKQPKRWKADIRTALVMSEILRRPYDENNPQPALWQG